MSKLLSALVGLAMLGSVGAASAAEPMTLSDAQMDSVVAAGNTSSGVGIGQFGLVNLAIASIIAGIGVQNE
jgi:hypothetical protein